MLSEQLQKKVSQSIQLIRSVGREALNHYSPLEVCYSGGKDSDVVLALVKMAGVYYYEAIYKNTTIDPSGTISHVKENGVKMRMPEMTFFQLIEQKGFPNRYRRFCCGYLKEYKIHNYAVLGIRRVESVQRTKNYIESDSCREFGKLTTVNQVYPILYWTDEDVDEFVREYNIKCHPLYYDEEGNFHVERRLGCMCCCMMYWKRRVEEFRRFPNMIKAYIKAGQKYRDSHPERKDVKRFASVYEWFCFNLFGDSSQKQFDKWLSTVRIEDGDYKSFIENYFDVKL